MYLWGWQKFEKVEEMHIRDSWNCMWWLLFVEIVMTTGHRVYNVSQYTWNHFNDRVNWMSSSSCFLRWSDPAFCLCDYLYLPSCGWPVSCYLPSLYVYTSKFPSLQVHLVWLLISVLVIILCVFVVFFFDRALYILTMNFALQTLRFCLRWLKCKLLLGHLYFLTCCHKVLYRLSFQYMQDRQYKTVKIIQWKLKTMHKKI